MPTERYYSMTELGEGVSFGDVTLNTAAAVFDSAYGRSCVLIGNSGVGDYFGSPPFLDAASTTEIWVHARLYLSGSLATTVPLIRLNNSSGTTVLRVRPSSAAYSGFVLEAWNGSSYTTIASAFGIPSAVLCSVDLHLVCGEGGLATVYIDKSAVTTGSVTASADNVANVRYGSPSSARWSQMAAANFDTRDLIIKCLPPTSAGVNTAATGDYTAVDENGVNDADMLVFASAGDKETMNPTDYTLPANVGVDSVWVAGRARGDTLDFKWLLRSGGADHESSELNVTTGFAPYARCWTTDPATGNQIDQTALNAFEFGGKAV